MFNRSVLTLWRAQRFVVGLAAALCTSMAAAQPLKIGVARTGLTLPFHVAQSRGFFAAEGVSVTLVECSTGVSCVAQMLEGKTDLSTASEMVGAMHAMTRSDFVLLAGFVSSPQEVKLLVRTDSGVRTWAHLEGKRIATVKGTSAQYYLDVALAYNGVLPRQVHLVTLAPEKIGPALQAGVIDAATLWEPFVYQVQQRMGPALTLLPAQRLYTTTFALYGMKKEVQRRQAEVVKVLRALARADAFISSNPADSLAILRKTLNVDVSSILVTWQSQSYSLSLSQSLLSTMESQARWAIRSQNAPPGAEMPNLLDILEPAPLRQVVPQAVSIVK